MVRSWLASTLRSSLVCRVLVLAEVIRTHHQSVHPPYQLASNSFHVWPALSYVPSKWVSPPFPALTPSFLATNWQQLRVRCLRKAWSSKLLLSKVVFATHYRLLEFDILTPSHHHRLKIFLNHFQTAIPGIVVPSLEVANVGSSV